MKDILLFIDSFIVREAQPCMLELIYILQYKFMSILSNFLPENNTHKIQNVYKGIEFLPQTQIF